MCTILVIGYPNGCTKYRQQCPGSPPTYWTDCATASNSGSSVTTSTPGGPVGPGPTPIMPLPFVFSSVPLEEWTVEHDKILDSLTAELQPFVGEDSPQSNQALGEFLVARGLPVEKVTTLNEAVREYGTPNFALRLGNNLSALGLHDQAIQSYGFIPELISRTGSARNNTILGEALQKKALSLNAVGRTAEASEALSTAQHFFINAGQLRGATRIR